MIKILQSNNEYNIKKVKEHLYFFCILQMHVFSRSSLVTFIKKDTATYFEKKLPAERESLSPNPYLTLWIEVIAKFFIRISKPCFKKMPLLETLKTPISMPGS